MTNFIPIFPLLHTVIYPDEYIDLHITEESHKQMVAECYITKKPFGAHFFINEQSCEIGTTLIITELTKSYEDEHLHIKARGVDVFRILEVIQNMPNKLYDGAIVNYPRNNKHPHSMMENILSVMKAVQTILGIATISIPKGPGQILSYDIAHQIGLSSVQEYELLELMQEDQRLEYIRRHLSTL